MPAPDAYFSQEPALSSAQDKITATAGGGQGAAFQLTAQISRVSTVATGGDSVKLPASVAGFEMTVLNGTASTSMNVFPATGDAINALGVNTAFAAAGGTVTIFYCASAGTWFTK